MTVEFVKRGMLGDYRRKVEWVMESAEKAGRDAGDIEFSASTINEGITDDPEEAYLDYAKSWGVSVDVVRGCPMVLVGSLEELEEKLFAFREETGISYFVLGMPSGENIRLFGESVVKDLTGR